MSAFIKFIRREPTFCAAFIAAAISCFFTPPDSEYLGYIDFRTLALLYCLMVIVAGLRRAGIFALMAHVLCRRTSTARGISLLLVLLCFFSAMLVTNDVALLTFVPFTVVVLGLAHLESELIWVVVLQTVAANLGSILTPVGNPQNLYLYSYYGMNIIDFVRITGPVWLISLAALCLLCLRVPRVQTEVFLGESPALDKRALAVYCALFALCLTVVFHLVSWPVALCVTIAVVAVFDRKRLISADFMLLATFVCFFVFSGNLARIPAAASFLRSALGGHELLAGALTSQLISNVPAALLLSGFTDNSASLLLGVNIGGLGTPVASLASLISLKLYTHADNADTGRYMKVFSAVNFIMLAALLVIARTLCGA